jgi:hypothetical protein
MTNDNVRGLQRRSERQHPPVVNLAGGIVMLALALLVAAPLTGLAWRLFEWVAGL